MATRMFRSGVDRTRRFVGWMFVLASMSLAGVLAWADIHSGRLTATAIVLFAVFGGMFFIGLRLLRPRDSFEIDAEQRTYSVLRDGERAGSGPLDALGPLEVRRSVYTPGLGPDRRPSASVTRYIVVAAIHPEIDFFEVRTAGKARRKMEALARGWRVPCRSLGGKVRGPDEVDVPLHRRLYEDAESRKARPLPSGSGISIEPLSLGYAMRSTRCAWSTLGPVVAFLVVALIAVSRSSPLKFLDELREAGELPPRIFVAGLVAIGLYFLCVIATAVRDTFFPGTVQVTDRGVSYRGSRMSLTEIEEVMPSYPIELIGDRKSLMLGATFCAPGDAQVVAHELQRLIIEVADLAAEKGITGPVPASRSSASRH